MREPAVLVSGKWYIAVEVQRPAYTVAEAMHILKRRSSFVQDLLDTTNELHGPAATRNRPIDHEALVRYLERKKWERNRAAIRNEALRLLKEQTFFQEE